mmetsp:Transcript_24696/g.79481  ORF Transcript_24696/g.79481 Transcript_24696/m.79481 type:complete len:508 (+) Transcript_24696:1287-2810(+)
MPSTASCAVSDSDGKASRGARYTPGRVRCSDKVTFTCLPLSSSTGTAASRTAIVDTRDGSGSSGSGTSVPTVRAIVPKWSSSARLSSAACASFPSPASTATNAWQGSPTVSPESFRNRCTRFTTSRASPCITSPSSRSRSTTTVSVPSASTAASNRVVSTLTSRRTVRSPSPSTTPATSSDPVARYSSTCSCVSCLTALSTGPMALPSRGPSTLDCAVAVSVHHLLSSASSSSSRMLSSSCTYCARSRTASSTAGSLCATTTRFTGILSEMLRRSRTSRPSSTTRCITCTLRTMAASTSDASTVGMDVKCTDSARPGASGGRLSLSRSGCTRRNRRYMNSVKKGVKGAMVRVSDSSASYSTRRAAAASSSAPLSRVRFRRTYQLVRSLMKRTSRGSTVYSRYAAISRRTNSTTSCCSASSQWSMGLPERPTAERSGVNGRPWAVSQRRAFCTKNRNALYQGSSRSRTTPFTPASSKRSGSARTTGESIRYMRSASAPCELATSMGSG